MCKHARNAYNLFLFLHPPWRIQSTKLCFGSIGMLRDYRKSRWEEKTPWKARVPLTCTYCSLTCKGSPVQVKRIFPSSSLWPGQLLLPPMNPAYSGDQCSHRRAQRSAAIARVTESGIPKLEPADLTLTDCSSGNFAPETMLLIKGL